MDSKKAQANALGIGIIMVAFVAIIVGVVLFQAIAQEAGKATDTTDLVNLSVTAGADGDSVYLTDYRAISVTSITNNTGAQVLTDVTDYTVTNNVIDPTTGGLSVQVTTNAATYESEVWYVSGTAQPTTYVGGAANSITGLIAIFFALAIAIIALEPTLRSGVLNMLGK